MNRYTRKWKPDVGRAYLREGGRWHPVKISTDATILVIQRKSGKRQTLSLYCCRLFRWPFFPARKGLLVQSFQGTVVLGFDTKAQRSKWDDTFRALRTIEANLATYTAHPIQIVAPSNQAKYFAMCRSGRYKPHEMDHCSTADYACELAPNRRPRRA